MLQPLLPRLRAPVQDNQQRHRALDLRSRLSRKCKHKRRSRPSQEAPKTIIEPSPSTSEKHDQILLNNYRSNWLQSSREHTTARSNVVLGSCFAMSQFLRLLCASESIWEGVI